MEELYKTIADTYTAGLIPDYVGYECGHISIQSFVEDPSKYLSYGLWYLEILRLSQEERTPWLDSIILIASAFSSAIMVEPPIAIIKANKHHILKIYLNIPNGLALKTAWLKYIIDGDKYILAVQKVKKRIPDSKWNYLQTYCQANYGNFHTHNDTDLYFKYYSA